MSTKNRPTARGMDVSVSAVVRMFLGRDCRNLLFLLRIDRFAKQPVGRANIFVQISYLRWRSRVPAPRTKVFEFERRYRSFRDVDS